MHETEILNMNIYQKLAKVRTLSDVAEKTKKGYNYSYIDITEILANVTAGMKKYRVSLIPSIKMGTANIVPQVTENTKFDKTGKQYINKTTEMMFQAEMIYTWINDDNPSEQIEVPWYVTGSMADCAQAMGAGLTYSLRQFLLSYFQIAQADNDIDAFRSKQKEAEVSEEKAIAEGIINAFDKQIRQFLADNPDKKDDVSSFVGKFAKKGNYLTIKDPELAAKLSEDFNKTFINEGKEK